MLSALADLKTGLGIMFMLNKKAISLILQDTILEKQVTFIVQLHLLLFSFHYS